MRAVPQRGRGETGPETGLDFLPIVLRMSPAVKLSDEQYFDLCQINEVLWIERHQP